MSGSTVILLVILLLGLWGHASVIAAAAAVLLVLQVTNLEEGFRFLEARGLELGLLFLMLAVLVPFAAGKVSGRELAQSFLTLPGMVMIVSGIIATNLNGQGLTMLQANPSLLIGLVIGSIIGVLFFGGIPVGPLMAGGIAALVMNVINFWR